MTDKRNAIPEILAAQAAEIAGLTVAITVLTHALLESCAIDKKKMLAIFDKHCAKLSQQLLEPNEQVSVDRLLLDIRSVVVEHMKQQ